jgi:3-oxoacyl-[acyl-carrier-protein] synthase II
MTGWITGLGWVTAAGCGHGRTAEAVPTWNDSLTIPTRKDLFAHADLRFGRLDGFSRTGLAGITMCLRDAGREEWQDKRAIATMAVTTGGCLQTDLDYLATVVEDGGKLASPNLFAYTLPNCFLGEAALRFGLTGNSLILQQDGGTEVDVLGRGLEELAWSGTAGVLAGFCEVPVTGLACPASGYGSLFVLIEADLKSRSGSYGKIALTDNQIFFNDVPMTSFGDLIDVCLTALKRRD